MLDQESKLNLRGYSIVDGEIEGNWRRVSRRRPAKGEQLEPVYHCASIDDLNLAADLAEEAFVAFRKLSGREQGPLSALTSLTASKPSCRSLWSAPIARPLCRKRA